MRKQSTISALLLCFFSATATVSAITPNFFNNWTAATSNNILTATNWQNGTTPFSFQSAQFGLATPAGSLSDYYNPSINCLLCTANAGEFAFYGPNTFNVSIAGGKLQLGSNGITNNTSVPQNFNVSAAGTLSFGALTSADSTQSGNVFINVDMSDCVFKLSSTASNANISVTNSNYIAPGFTGLNFQDDSTAGNSNITLDNSQLGFQDYASLGSAHIVAKNGSTIFQNSTEWLSTASIDLYGSNLVLGDAASSYPYVAAGLELRRLNGDASSVIELFGVPLTINNTEDCTFAGNFITAFPGYIPPFLIKKGPATFTLSGNNTSNKLILVEEGTLHLDNVIINNILAANLGGVLVRDKGTLSGNAFIFGEVAVYSGGTISPGNSIGTITMTTAFVQNVGGIYDCEVDRAGNSDRIVVTTGFAQIAGTLAVSDIGGRLLYNKYLILSTPSSPIVGKFGIITDNNPLVHDFVDYSDPTKAYLYFTQNLIAAAESSNEINVANALDSITNPTPDELTVLNALINLPFYQARCALDALSGEEYSYIIQVDRSGNERLNRRIYNAIRPALSPCFCVDPCTTLQTWFQIEGGQSYAHGNCKSPGMRSNNWDFTLGAYAPLCDGFLIGGALNYQMDRLHFCRGGNTTWHTGQGAIYAGYQNECAYGFADFIFGYSSGDFKRRMQFDEINRTAKSTPKTKQGIIYAEVGLNAIFREVLFQPFFAIEGGFYDQRKIKEHGADSLNLSIKKKNLDTADTYLGLHVTTFWDCFKLSGDVAWQHRYDNSYVKTTNSFQDFDGSFSIKGKRFGNDAVKAAIDISTDLCDAVTIYAEFSGERWNNWGAYGIDLGIGVWW